MYSCPDKFTVLSPAKLNIGLSVIGRREDGYHLLESLFWPIDFADCIVVTNAEKAAVDCCWHPDVPNPTPLPKESENLAFRAIGGRTRCRASIVKRIPMGSGMGGGSSNAGTLLRVLRDAKSLSEEQAAQIAVGLGADVPFFLDPRPTWVGGIGEQRQAISVSKELMRVLHFLLIILPEPTHTGSLFSKLRDGTFNFSKSSQFDWGSPLDLAGFGAYAARARNDLQGAACAQYPLIAAALEKLRDFKPLHFSMSGSGSTCFAVFDGAPDCVRAAKDLLPFCRKFSCYTVMARTFGRD